MKRNCEVCGSSRKSYIYAPVFYLPNQRKPFKYDIALCKRCGFLFADNIPSQKEYEIFYKNNAKYAYNENIPAGLKNIYKDIFIAGMNFLRKYYRGLDKNKFKVLDIGCSIGYILNLFKRSGFKEIKGIEPSLYCRAVAKKLYGIEVINSPLSKFSNNEKFDLIIMTGVLEHVSSLNETLCKVSDLLDEDGLLMVVVPDVDRFSKNPCVPFDEFSIEHINYFNKNTLSNLAGEHCFKNIYTKKIDSKFYDSNSVLSLFKKSKKIEIKSDRHGYSAIEHYIVASERRLGIAKRRIHYLIKSKSPIAIWGAGSLTSRLLASTDLLMANIKFFVDSNKMLQGKRICNITIVSPDIFKKLGKEYKVLISSHTYGREMKDILASKYCFEGEAVML
jgi:2-polyprenyl-3-methyl-5-hydroxy-6-metoxy-1,4-benzoquinol methylase